jgi:hypothetical protein
MACVSNIRVLDKHSKWSSLSAGTHRRQIALSQHRLLLLFPLALPRRTSPLAPWDSMAVSVRSQKEATIEIQMGLAGAKRLFQRCLPGKIRVLSLNSTQRMSPQDMRSSCGLGCMTSQGPREHATRCCCCWTCTNHLEIFGEDAIRQNVVIHVLHL